MHFRLLYNPASPASLSPYRVVDEQGREAGLVNEFLDAQHVRGLSLCSLRAYGYDGLHFARWWFPDPPRPFSAIDDSTVLDYLRYQLATFWRKSEGLSLLFAVSVGGTSCANAIAASEPARCRAVPLPTG